LLIVATDVELAQGQDQSLPQPTQQVILSITGKIERTNSKTGALFDKPMLEALGLEKLRTSTPWTAGTVEFVGVPAQKVMDAVGARGKTAIASALDNYRAEIPISDFERYRVLFALRMNGQELARDRAPIWIVYPRDDFPELQDEKVNTRWVWQLNSLAVE
jgi:hypothetical protein